MRRKTVANILLVIYCIALAIWIALSDNKAQAFMISAYIALSLGGIMALLQKSGYL